MKGEIYRITNNTNGKVYVGQSRAGTKRRCTSHFSKLRGGYHPNPHLQASFLEYGESAFSTGSLMAGISTRDELTCWESHFIELYGSTDPEKGFNLISPGLVPETPSKGFTGRRHTEETRKRIARQGERNGFHGKTHSAGRRAEDSLRKRNGTPFPLLKSPEGTIHTVEVSLSEFARTFDLSRPNLSSLIAGKLRHTKGWTVCTE